MKASKFILKVIVTLAVIIMVRVSVASAQGPTFGLYSSTSPNGDTPINNWNPQNFNANAQGSFSQTFVNNTGIPFPDFSITWTNPGGPTGTGGSDIYTTFTATESGQLEIDDFSGGTIPNNQQFEVTAEGFPVGGQLTLTPTPEPSSFALTGLGTFGLLAYMLRRRAKAQGIA